MFKKETETKVNEAIELELSNACELYGEKYHSLHEGYAVLKEEIEEAANNLNYINENFADLWECVKSDDELSVKSQARFIAFGAVQLALEAIQVAAVARKILGDGESV
jgi:hypothetical protein